MNSHLTVAALLTSACIPDPAPAPTPGSAGSTPAKHPIDIVDGGFVDARTGQPFPVRGTNYFTIVSAGDRLQRVEFQARTGRRKGSTSGESVDSFVAEQRKGRLDDPEYWEKRFGFVPPALRRR